MTQGVRYRSAEASKFDVENSSFKGDQILDRLSQPVVETRELTPTFPSGRSVVMYYHNRSFPRAIA
jgi:hypothetical protein